MWMIKGEFINPWGAKGSGVLPASNTSVTNVTNTRPGCGARRAWRGPPPPVTQGSCAQQSPWSAGRGQFAPQHIAAGVAEVGTKHWRVDIACWFLVAGFPHTQSEKATYR